MAIRGEQDRSDASVFETEGDAPLFETEDGVTAYVRRNEGPRATAYAASLLVLAAAALLAILVEPISGVLLGMAASLATALNGTFHWTDRLAEQRWLPRVSRLEVTVAPGEYREGQAVRLTADGEPRTVRCVTVNRHREKGPRKEELYAVLLECESGLAEVDRFTELADARRLANALAETLHVRTRRTAVEDPAQNFPGTRFLLSLVPMLFFAPAVVALRENAAWSSAVALALYLLAHVGLYLQMRTSSGKSDEQRFRERLERSAATYIRVDPSLQLEGDHDAPLDDLEEVSADDRTRDEPRQRRPW